MIDRDFIPRLTPMEGMFFNPCVNCQHYLRCNADFQTKLRSRCEDYHRQIYWTHDSSALDLFFADAKKLDDQIVIADGRFQMEIDAIEMSWVKDKPCRKLDVILPSSENQYRIKAMYWDELPKRLLRENVIEAAVRQTPNRFTSLAYRKIPTFTLYGVVLLKENKWG